MSDYRRFVSYLFSYENGMKKENVGYARIESYKEQCKINIYMKDAAKREQKAGVYLFYREEGKAKGIFVKEMEMKNGLGNCKITTNKANIENSSYRFDQIGGIVVYVSPNRFWGTEWDDRPINGFEPQPRNFSNLGEKAEPVYEPAKDQGHEREEKVEPRAEEELAPKEERQDEIGTGGKKEGISWANVPKVEEPALGVAPAEPEEEMAEEPEGKPYLEPEGEATPEEAMQAVAAANVEAGRREEWSQGQNRMAMQESLDYEREREERDRFAPYTKIYPFYEQNKECIGIQPKDLGKISPILEQWQDNNFLLHGYGRFRHILLLRRKGSQGEEYFIGVPGMYRPREESLAVTYGFSMFVPMKKEKAEYGDFGYWCTQVKLPETDF